MGDPRNLLKIHPNDNVAVCTHVVVAGDRTEVDGAVLEITEAVATGHKVAVCAIANGDQILKYGVVIGRATRNIAAGAHVHTHNMTSNYLSIIDTKTDGTK